MLTITGDWNAKRGSKAVSNLTGSLDKGADMKEEIGLWLYEESTMCPS